MSVDVEIYMNNILKFFRENPEDLQNLVPKNKEQEFYKRVRETAIVNFTKGEEVGLTQPQMIDICVKINKRAEETIYDSTDHLFIKTKFGNYCLN